MTSGVSVYLWKLFKLDKCCGQQKGESQSSLAWWSFVSGMLEDCERFTALGCCHFDATFTDNHYISMAAEIFEHKRHFSNTIMGCEGHLAD